MASNFFWTYFFYLRIWYWFFKKRFGFMIFSIFFVGLFQFHDPTRKFRELTRASSCFFLKLIIAVFLSFYMLYFFSILSFNTWFVENWVSRFFLICFFWSTNSGYEFNRSIQVGIFLIFFFVFITWSCFFFNIFVSAWDQFFFS